MRSIRNPRLERGEVRIEDIALDHKCRDDLIAILIGIQYLLFAGGFTRASLCTPGQVYSARHQQKGGTSGHGYVEHSGIGTDQARYELRL